MTPGVFFHDRSFGYLHFFRVEIDAKIASGYFSGGKKITESDLVHTKGREWDDIVH